MMIRKSLVACLGALILVVAGTASAHHSFAMFDRSKKITTVATVTQFQWTNPHSWIEIDVPDSKGGTTHWSLECNSPNNLSRQGWHSDSLKPGDKITVMFWPLRNGDKGGLFIALTLANGQALDEAAFRSAEKQP
ncbi:MAG: DUF6152 family protein [Candidatus Acidiferrales bacterium]